MYWVSAWTVWTARILLRIRTIRASISWPDQAATWDGASALKRARALSHMRVGVTMIANETLDIVSIATYTPTHAEIAIACAERGIPVIYCEKPAATTVIDAQHMLEAQKHGLLVFNHQRRFDPNYRRLRTLIAEGKLGTLISALSNGPRGDWAMWEPMQLTPS